MTRQKTVYSYTLTATGKFTAGVFLLGNRVLLHKPFEMLEPCEGRLSRTVLRGLGASNGPWLPDRRLVAVAVPLQEVVG